MEVNLMLKIAKKKPPGENLQRLGVCSLKINLNLGAQDFLIGFDNFVAHLHGQTKR